MQTPKPLISAVLVVLVSSTTACETDLYEHPRGDPSPYIFPTDATHTGWQQADCFACHVGIHSNAYGVAHCGICHGGNGGLQLTEENHSAWGDGDCQDCHNNVAGHAADLTVAACAACHGGNGALALPDNPLPPLNDSHQGWRLASCKSCHTGPISQHSHYSDTTCGACHGTNGGPLRPDGHWLTHCNDCHAVGPDGWNGVTHEGYDLDCPRSCRACHQ